MNPLYPIKLSYVTRSPLWGGRRLLDGWGMKAEADTVGEAWMLSVRKKEMSVIGNGDFEGKTMQEYIDECGSAVIGTAYAGGDFPLLVKVIDACDKLSVQVHPDDEMARALENGVGKTEMWYVVKAESNAKIYCGVKNGVTKEDIKDAIEKNTLEKKLKVHESRQGDVFFVEAGTVHAIGSGNLILEIQLFKISMIYLKKCKLL